MDAMRLPELPDLPVRAALGEITRALAGAGAAVLVAPPGTGKTTLVPLALAAAGDGRVLVAEPRRLATRAAAARMAALLGEPVGRTVGYAVRGERRTSPGTRVEVVTSGLLLRRLAADPELPGVGTVVLDECHERHLDADLLLALLLDARDGLRPDLRLLATSATVAGERLAGLLGGPVLAVEARTFPVDVRHDPPARGERIEACAARAVRAALREGDGDVLAFLPGVAEIRRTAAALDGLDADVLALHGRLPAAEQDAALRPGPRRRVVLATAVAESSLTVPGVRAVVDAGLARVPRTDHRRGMSGLVTLRVSAAVADQRAGRAGREGPGRVHRCWPAGELLPRFPEPEIRTADLTRLALDLAVWGTPDGSGLRWWDAPPEGPLRAGREVLRALGAVDGGRVTERGRRMAGLGLHPRAARALLDGAALVGARAAAEVVALLDDDTLADGADADDALRRLRSGAAPATGRWRAEARRLERLVREAPTAAPGGAGSAARVVALAHPERLARRRSGQDAVYLTAGGTAVETGAFPGAEWLAVAVADRAPGAEHGRVRLAAVADEDLAVAAAPALLDESEEIAWGRGPAGSGDVVARHVRRLGAIVLHSRPLTDPRRRSCGRPCSTACAARGSTCCAGATARAACATGSPRCTGCWPGRGRTCPTRRCWPRPTAGGRAARAAAPTWPAWTPPVCCGRCSTGATPRWTSWRPNGSRCRPAPGSRWTGRATGPCSPSACRSASAGPTPRRSRRGGCRSCCTCSPPPAARWPSPATWRRSGRPGTRRCGGSCAVATPGTPGPRTRCPPRRAGVAEAGAGERVFYDRRHDHPCHRAARRIVRRIARRAEDPPEGGLHGPHHPHHRADPHGERQRRRRVAGRPEAGLDLALARAPGAGRGGVARRGGAARRDRRPDRRPHRRGPRAAGRPGRRAGGGAGAGAQGAGRARRAGRVLTGPAVSRIDLAPRRPRTTACE
jgi:ATP-dependent helicase HrpB